MQKGDLKMAKKSKKSSKLSLILKIVILTLGVLSLVMAFVQSVKFVNSEGDIVEGFTGFQTMFGYAETKTALGTEVTTKYLAFSFFATLAFVLPVVGAILSLLKNKIVRLVGASLMVVGAVLIFVLPSLTVLATVDGNLTIASLVLDKCSRALGIGAILAGIFSAIGGIVSGYAVLSKK